MRKLIAAVGCFIWLAGGAMSGPASAQLVASATVDTIAPGKTINPEIYGQFAEHLGSGIDRGIWVGPNSPIANVDGYRRDVVIAREPAPA